MDLEILLYVGDYSQLWWKSATNNFHLSNKLGQGGFGSVYKVMVALLKFYYQIL